MPTNHGNKLKISTLAVLLAILAGWLLAGVIGASTALPLVAAYPSLERLGFAKQLAPEVLKEHEDLRAAQGGTGVFLRRHKQVAGWRQPMEIGLPGIWLTREPARVHGSSSLRQSDPLAQRPNLAVNDRPRRGKLQARRHR